MTKRDDEKDRFKKLSERKFYASDVTRILKIKRTTLQQWMQLGLIIPSFEKAGGSGKRNTYTFGDLCLFSLYEKLVRIGVHRETAAIFLRGTDLSKMIQENAKIFVISGLFGDARKSFYPMEWRFAAENDVTIHNASHTDVSLVISISNILKDVTARIEE